jgi:hypothetical protein
MVDVRCESCLSNRLNRFPAEVSIHVPGLKNIRTPTVLVFPQLEVCLACGKAQFAVPEAELRLLETVAAA